MDTHLKHDAGKCTARNHDRSLPDGGKVCVPDAAGGDTWFAAGGDQRIAADGLLGCNDCGRELYHCTNSGHYYHVDKDVECFLAPSNSYA